MLHSIKSKNYSIFKSCCELWEEWKNKNKDSATEMQKEKAKYFIFKAWYDAKKEESLLIEYADRLKEFGLEPTLENISMLKKMGYKRA